MTDGRVNVPYLVTVGNCLDVLAKLPDDSVDSVVTDPPYGLEFMGKEWDKLGDVRQPGDDDYVSVDNPYGRSKVRHSTSVAYGVAGAGRAMYDWHLAWAREVFRVLKPGGHLLAFGGSRTVHRLACAIEDAGFEIRDSIHWTYLNGFPKSLDVAKAIDKAAGVEGTWEAKRWSGWGTALKPSHEPIVVARKPLIGTVARNVEAHGTGALNIDGCRIPTPPQKDLKVHGRSAEAGKSKGIYGGSGATETQQKPGQALGYWPMNTIVGHGPDCAPGACTPGCPVAAIEAQAKDTSMIPRVDWSHEQQDPILAEIAAIGFAKYCQKATPKERDAGLSGEAARLNIHPTVKPIALMRWLVRLVTPPGGVVLDPFGGSGTTGCAAVLEGFYSILIEQDANYATIAQNRIWHWYMQKGIK